MPILTEGVCDALDLVMGEIYTPEYLSERVEDLIEQRLHAAARDLTSMAVLEWNWPAR